MYEKMWNNKNGWWWKRYGSGGFTIWEFMAIVFGYEQSGYPYIEKFATALGNAADSWCHVHCDPYTAEGSMIFLSRYSQSARMRMKRYGEGMTVNDLFQPLGSWADHSMMISERIRLGLFTGAPMDLFAVANVSLRSKIFGKMINLGMVDTVWGQGNEDRFIILTYCQMLMVNYAIFNGGAKAINQRTYNSFCGG